MTRWLGGSCVAVLIAASTLGVARAQSQADRSSRVERAPVFLPHAPYWRHVLAPADPEALLAQARAARAAAHAAGQIALEAKSLLVEAELTPALGFIAGDTVVAAQLAERADDPATAVDADLLEAFRAYREGDTLSSRAYVYKTLSDSALTPAATLRAVSLLCLIESPPVSPASPLLPEEDGRPQTIAFGDAPGLLADRLQMRGVSIGSLSKEDASWVALVDGYLQLTQGGLAEANRTWREVAAAAPTPALTRGLAELGLSYLATIGGDQKQAVTSANDALAVFQKAAIPGGIGQAHLALAELAFLRKDSGEGAHQVREARAAFQSMRYELGAVDAAIVQAAGDNRLGRRPAAEAGVRALENDIAGLGSPDRSRSLRVPAAQVGQLSEFLLALPDMLGSVDTRSLEQRVHDGFKFSRWSDEATNVALRLVATEYLARAFGQAGHSDGALQYGQLFADLSRHYVAVTPLRTRIRKAAYLSYDILREAHLFERGLDVLSTMDYAAFGSVLDGMRRGTGGGNSADSIGPRLMAAANTAERSRQRVRERIAAGDRAGTVAAVAALFDDVRTLFEKTWDLAPAVYVLDSHQPMSSEAPQQRMRVKVDLRAIYRVEYPAATLLERSRNKAMFDYMRDVSIAALDGDTTKVERAADQYAAFFEQFPSIASDRRTTFLPFVLANTVEAETAAASADAQEVTRRISQGLDRETERIRNQMRAAVLPQGSLLGATDITDSILDIVNNGNAYQFFVETFERDASRSHATDQTVSRTKEGDWTVITVARTLDLVYVPKPVSVFSRLATGPVPLDILRSLRTIRAHLDAFASSLRPRLDTVVEQFRGYELQQALADAWSAGRGVGVGGFVNIVAAAQLALSVTSRTDFIGMPGFQPAESWKEMFAEQPELREMAEGVARANNAWLVAGSADQSEVFDAASAFVQAFIEQPETLRKFGDQGADATDWSAPLGLVASLASLSSAPGLIPSVVGDHQGAASLLDQLIKARERLDAGGPLDTRTAGLGGDVNGSRRTSAVAATLNLGLIATAEGRYPLAIDSLERLRTLVAAQNAGVLFQVEYLLAVVARRSGLFERERYWLSESTRHFDEVRRSLLTRDLVLLLQPVRQVLYEEGIGAAVRANDTTGAFDMMARYKEASQLPARTIASLGDQSSAITSMIRRTKVVYEFVDEDPDSFPKTDLRKELVESLASGRVSGARVSAASAVGRIASLAVAQLANYAPEKGRELVRPGPDALLISYFVGTKRLYTAHVDQRGTPTVLSQSLDPSGLEKWCATLRAQFAGEENQTEPSASLYRLLLGNVPDLEKKKRLLIWPDGPLSLIPFQALRASRTSKYLIETHAVSYLAGVVGSGQSPTVPARLLLIGNPDGTLTSADREVAQIATTRGYSTGVPLKTDAVPTRISARLGDTQGVHFATHATSRPGAPPFSFIQLAGNNRLYSLDLDDLTFNGKQIFLSACETRVGPTVAGEDPYGIADAFLAVGATSVVATLWRVESDSTSVFAPSYYELLLTVRDPGEVIALVARDFISGQRFLNREGSISPLSEPRFWSGFNYVIPAWQHRQ